MIGRADRTLFSTLFSPAQIVRSLTLYDREACERLANAKGVEAVQRQNAAPAKSAEIKSDALELF